MSAPADPEHLQAVKARLADIDGIDQLSVMMIGGRMVFGIKGLVIGLDPFAGDTEIETAIRLALSAPAAAASDAHAAAPIPTPMAATPVKQAVPVTKAPTMTTPASGGFAASIKAMLDQAKAGVAKAQSDGLAKVQTAVGKLNDAATHTAAVSDTMAQSIEDQANSVLAELGQISNLPPTG